MSRIEARLAELGHVLPEAVQLPAGMVLPFPEVNIRGNRAIISGQGPLNPDGSIVICFFELIITMIMDVVMT